MEPEKTSEPPVTPVVETQTPKTKEEWDKLSAENPGQWKKLTQERFDTTFRQNKELEEKLRIADEQKRNYELELSKYKPREEPAPEPGSPQYGPGQYPKTEEEWNDLFLERPVFATDLRNAFTTEQANYSNEYVATWNRSIETVAAEHPEMYLPEMDAEGKPKLDENGKIVLKREPGTNNFFFNYDTPTSKLWCEIVSEGEVIKKHSGMNPYKDYANSPTLLMAEMERRLRMKGRNMINNEQSSSVNQDESSLGAPGVTPPKTGPVKFASEEQRKDAEKRIKDGIYKSTEEYMYWQNVPENHGVVEKNREPDFTKR